MSGCAVILFAPEVHPFGHRLLLDYLRSQDAMITAALEKLKGEPKNDEPMPLEDEAAEFGEGEEEQGDHSCDDVMEDPDA